MIHHMTSVCHFEVWVFVTWGQQSDITIHDFLSKTFQSVGRVHNIIYNWFNVSQVKCILCAIYYIWKFPQIAASWKGGENIDLLIYCLVWGDSSICQLLVPLSWWFEFFWEWVLWSGVIHGYNYWFKKYSSFLMTVVHMDHETFVFPMSWHIMYYFWSFVISFPSICFHCFSE